MNGVKTLAIAIICAIAGTAPALASPIHFPGNGHYYDFMNVSLSWDDANVAAQQQIYLGVAGHLATVTTAAEQSFVYNQIYRPNIPVATDAYATWLGGYQVPASAEPAGGWTWATGEIWNYVNWGTGEPNNGVGFGLEPEDKLVMWGTGFWNDFVAGSFGAPGVGPIGYLIEFDTVPEPSALALTGFGAVVLTVIARRNTHSK